MSAWPTLSVAPNVDRPPWNWNPVETYLTAYTAMQENQRAQEKAGMEAELSRILLPERAAKAAFNIKQLAYESKLLEKSYNAQSAELDDRMGIISGNGGGGGDAAEDDFQAIPYQGADAGGPTSPSEGNQIAAADGGEERAIAMNTSGYPPYPNRPNNADESGYNFSLAGSPFEDEPTNPLYNLPTDDLGERIAMGDPSSMGAGAPAATAKVADTAPVDLALSRDLPLGEDGRPPNMLGAPNPLEKFADQTPDPAPATEKAQPQGSGDPFYDWSTQTLGPWVSKYNERKAALSDNLAKGRIKAPAFYSGRDQLKQKADTMVASALLKLDADQASQYKVLLQSEVEPLDALLQVSSARPRKGLGGEGAVDQEAAQKERAMLMYNIGEATKNLESLAPGSPEHENLTRVRNQNTQQLALRTTPKVKVQDFDDIRKERTKVSRLLEVNPDLAEGSGLVDMFTQTPIQSSEEANAYLNRLEQRQTNQLVELETSPETWKFLTSAQRDFKDAKEYAKWEKEAPENTPYINELGRFTIKNLKPRKKDAPQAESLSADNPYKGEYETAQEGTKKLNSDVSSRQLNFQLQSYKKQLAELNDAPAPLGSKTWRANQWEKLSKKIQEIESTLNELQGS